MTSFEVRAPLFSITTYYVTTIIALLPSPICKIQNIYSRFNVGLNRKFGDDIVGLELGVPGIVVLEPEDVPGIAIVILGAVVATDEIVLNNVTYLSLSTLKI